MNDLVDKIAAAIARFEGFYVPNSRAQRNNNPGNLRRWGNTPVVDGFASFPTLEAGWAALRRQVEINIGRGLTLNEFFAGKPGVYAGYAPASDNNHPINYARFVGGKAGVPVDIPLGVAGQVPATWPAAPKSGEETGLMLAAAATLVLAAAWWA